MDGFRWDHERRKLWGLCKKGGSSWAAISFWWLPFPRFKLMIYSSGCGAEMVLSCSTSSGITETYGHQSERRYKILYPWPDGRVIYCQFRRSKGPNCWTPSCHLPPTAIFCTPCNSVAMYTQPESPSFIVSKPQPHR